jgi:peptide-methionine (R)-S-oxide reductase
MTIDSGENNLDSNENKAKSEPDLHAKLDAETYRITQQKGTEAAFTGKYLDLKEGGVYHCSVCGADLFSSATKYDSGSGWPSFYAPSSTASVRENVDHSLGMVRTEVVCSECDAHLGHVFADGPVETGLRYCINSASLDFEKSNDEAKG